MGLGPGRTRQPWKILEAHLQNFGTEAELEFLVNLVVNIWNIGWFWNIFWAPWCLFHIKKSSQFWAHLGTRQDFVQERGAATPWEAGRRAMPCHATPRLFRNRLVKTCESDSQLKPCVTADARAPFDCHSLFACGFLVGATKKLSSHFLPFPKWKDIRENVKHWTMSIMSKQTNRAPNLVPNLFKLQTYPSQTWPYHHSPQIRNDIDTPHRDFETWLGVACVAQCCGSCAPCAPCALPGTKSCSWRQVAVVETLEFVETLETWRVERRFCPRCSREKKRPGKFTDSSHSDQTPILNYDKLCWSVLNCWIIWI